MVGLAGINVVRASFRLAKSDIIDTGADNDDIIILSFFTSTIIIWGILGRSHAEGPGETTCMI